jgi:hypothetical protein
MEDLILSWCLNVIKFSWAVSLKMEKVLVFRMLAFDLTVMQLIAQGHIKTIRKCFIIIIFPSRRVPDQRTLYEDSYCGGMEHFGTRSVTGWNQYCKNKWSKK